jgi:drug/metabolite transporter (DMT)-like permease
MLIYLGALICVICTAAGQVLFKAGANAVTDASTVLAVRPALLLLTAFSVYFFTSMGWMLLLRRAPLGQLYPVMALSFILVPAASYLFFGEQFSGRYFVGVALIVAGVVLCVKS